MTTELRTNIVLRYMAETGMMPDDGVVADDVINYGLDRGFKIDEMEAALVRATTKRWITVVDYRIYLTRLGHVLINAANDNR